MPKYYVESGWVRMILDATNAERAAVQVCSGAAKGKPQFTPTHGRGRSGTRKPWIGNLRTKSE